MKLPEAYDPCPCGSGKTYKFCCRAKGIIPGLPPGLVAGIRMKGGVTAHPSGSGYVAMVHTWDNAECYGEPKEWHASTVFATEDAAMEYYKKDIRPALKDIMAQVAKKGQSQPGRIYPSEIGIASLITSPAVPH